MIEYDATIMIDHGKPGDDVRKTRFGSYFPRLFAYAHSTTDDDTQARDIAVESFARVLAVSDDLSERAFMLELFSTARQLCDKRGRREDGLDVRERDALALLFDARLSHQQICSLMRIKEDALMSIVLRGLRKLRAVMAPVQPPAFFRLT